MATAVKDAFLMNDLRCISIYLVTMKKVQEAEMQ